MLNAKPEFCYITMPITQFTPHDVTTVIEHLVQQPWAMWLDSCNSDHIDNRFDIFVWQPLTSVTTLGQQTTVQCHQSGGHHLTTEDPLAVVEQQISQHFGNNQIGESTLPFKGGAVGYFSYDLGRAFEKLPSTAAHDVAIHDMAVGIYDRALIVDKSDARVYLFCREDLSTTILDELGDYRQTAVKATPFALTSPWQSNMTQAQYTEKFDVIQQYLLSGDCYQINLAQRFSTSYHGDAFTAYQSLRTQNNAPFSAYINLDDVQVLSISPERFLQVSDNKVQTKPIKGTRPRSNDANQDERNKQSLTMASKDKAENLMIVDLLRNDISRACLPGSVKVPKLFDIESFPAVHHLVSTVEGQLADHNTSLDLLRGAFPGGSITGAPKIRAMEIIEELEPHRRNIYCGSIGYISSCGNMDTSITIRTLTCHNNTIYCSAGGGIVADSIADDEYQETLDKVNKILPVLTAL